MLALEGIQVLDLSRLAPGPYCTMLLADLGADVTLVEEAGPGAAQRRRLGRFPLDGPEYRRALAFDALSRNKRSIALNLKSQEGREVFLQLAATADVIVEGFRPGVVQRLGVGYDHVASINPRVVYCSLSGYGQTGPYSQLPGHDINYISIGGALGMIGRPGSAPSIPMNLLADFAGGGQQAALAIVVALLSCSRSGAGQYLDVAMSDGVLSLLASAASNYLATGVVPRPGEMPVNGGAPHYDTYETADGRWLSIGCLEPWFWERLCRTLGLEEFLAEEFNTSRYKEISTTFRAVFKTRDRDQWFKLLSEADLCVAPVLALDEALVDPHNRAREMIVELQHDELGSVRQIGIPTKFSKTPGSVRTFAPSVGQHTDAILRAIGYNDERIAQLRAGSDIA